MEESSVHSQTELVVGGPKETALLYVGRQFTDREDQNYGSGLIANLQLETAYWEEEYTLSPLPSPQY